MVEPQRSRIARQVEDLGAASLPVESGRRSIPCRHEAGGLDWEVRNWRSCSCVKDALLDERLYGL